MKSAIKKLEDHIDSVGHLEGAPTSVIEEAKEYGRYLILHAIPIYRLSPADARCRAAEFLRRRTCRVK